MAPKKRKTDNVGSSSAATTTTTTIATTSTTDATITTRSAIDATITSVTRSTASLAKATNQPAAADPELPKKKKAKTTTTANKKAKAPLQMAEPEPAVLEGSKTIVIEHCKQCNSFKTRAIQVKNGLEKGPEGLNLVINPEKPRRGCFEIREEGEEVYVSPLDMKRPFTAMKALDMEKVISDIIEKLQ